MPIFTLEQYRWYTQLTLPSFGNFAGQDKRYVKIFISMIVAYVCTVPTLVRLLQESC